MLEGGWKKMTVETDGDPPADVRILTPVEKQFTRS